MGHRTYVGKTVMMFFRYFRGLGTQSEASYDWHMTGEGLAYWTQQRVMVQCPDHGTYLVVGLLAVYWQTQNCVYIGVGGG